MSLIEEQFVLKTNGNEAYRVLVNFWSCIKIHVPNILSCVSQVFPHYTKHDVSHSYAILDSIERILGKEAIEKKLSVTDLWLLLCSAFYHDIGMYISGKEVQDCFKSEKFQKYLCDLKDDTKLPLSKFANCFAIKDGKLNYDNCELSLDSYNAARYLLADFFRVNHANRSKDFLQADPSVAQMFSEINRLITTIAEICRLHGESFQEVMKCNDVENGVNGIEDYCHPRFAACMLRLGDLLDFDSSRVSRFSLDHLSSSIPSDSKIHNEKNYCIKHAIITPEKVDVLAECKDVEVAFEIDRWFTSINEEMSNQRNYWHDIVADLDIKGFPMRGNLNINLLGYEIIDNNLKPKFEVDDEKAIKILQGSGLYNNKFDCIREILQNAVDATYLRIYLEKKNEFAEKKLDDGFETFFNICKQPEYQIEVRCKKKEIEEENKKKEGENKDKKKKYVWHFEIQDHGIGLRKSDLKYLMKIGSGKNNKNKFDIIKKMPEYAKPSGIFGIGFQSIFLITEKVNIKSRYAFGDEVIDVDVGTPLKGGFAVLKTESDVFADKGTTISFDVMENTESYDNYDSYFNYSSYYNCFNEIYDFVKNKKSDIEVAEILEAVNRVSKNSYLNIICYDGNELNRKDDVKKIDLTIKEEKENENYKRIYQDETSNLIVEIPQKNINSLSKDISELEASDENDRYYNEIGVLYRNQYVGHSLNIKYINLKINILSGYSDDVLSVNRESLKSEYVNRINEPLIRIFIQWIIDNWKNFDEDGKKAASMFIEYYEEDDNKYKDRREKWKELKVCGFDFNKEYYKVIMRVNPLGRLNINDEEKKNTNLKIINGTDSRAQFIGYVLKKSGKYGIYYNGFENLNKSYYDDPYDIIFEKNLDRCFCSMDWPFWLEQCRVYECRLLIPCFGYEKLQIKEDLIPKNVSEPIGNFEKKLYPRTVCPYIVKDEKLVWDCSDELVRWVRENNIKDKDNVTEDDIRNEYENMKKILSEYVNADGEIIKKPKAKKDIKSKNASKPKKQVEKKAESKVVPKTSKTGKKQAKAKAKKS